MKAALLLLALSSCSSVGAAPARCACPDVAAMQAQIIELEKRIAALETRKAFIGP